MGLESSAQLITTDFTVSAGLGVCDQDGAGRWEAVRNISKLKASLGPYKRAEDGGQWDFSPMPSSPPLCSLSQ